MHIHQQTRHTSIYVYIILILASLLTIGYMKLQDDMALTTYQNVTHVLDAQQTTKVALDGSTQPIHITDWSIFNDDSIWTYSGLGAAYETTYVPRELEAVPVAHSLDEDMLVQSVIAAPLERLFDAATADGHRLIIASAYRSIADQQSLYDTFAQTQGAEQANSFVATPGESEHHTGLAVDIDTYSQQCLDDSFSCSLEPAASAWLKDTAWQYGFTLRYPEGKQSITGISGEAWHYRYVGRVLAKALYESDITFDEFIASAAPGRMFSE